MGSARVLRDIFSWKGYNEKLWKIFNLCPITENSNALADISFVPPLCFNEKENAITVDARHLYFWSHATLHFSWKSWKRIVDGSYLVLVCDKLNISFACLRIKNDRFMLTLFIWTMKIVSGSPIWRLLSHNYSCSPQVTTPHHDSRWHWITFIYILREGYGSV